VWIEAETLRVSNLVRLFSYSKITRGREAAWKQVARANPMTTCARHLVNDCDVTLAFVLLVDCVKSLFLRIISWREYYFTIVTLSFCLLFGLAEVRVLSFYSLLITVVFLI